MSTFHIDIELERRSPGDRAFRLAADLESDAGVTVLFGPSGAGKSTLLLAVVGAITPRRGRITVAGSTVFDSESGTSVPTHRRRIGIVFQDALLFPHLDARDNVAFGMSGGDVRRRAGAYLEKVGAAGLARTMPHDLSGGERQRVALARALASEPTAVLLDEPFSALDAGSREALGDLLLEMQSDTSVPFLHVTHDIGEALRLGEHMVVLDDGRVVQEGPPPDIVRHPTSKAAARAVGTENLFSARVVRHFPSEGYTAVDLEGTTVEIPPVRVPPGGRLALALRAEDVLLSLGPVHHTSARNVLPGEVIAVAPGERAVEVTVATPVPIRARVTPASVRELGLEEGTRVHLLVKVSAFQVVV